MKVTIKYIDDSTSVLNVNEDKITLNSDETYFMLENEDEEIIGWIVRENVKYVIIGELIDSFKDSKPENGDLR